MNKFNIRFREMELHSCDDMNTLAEIILWRKLKTGEGEVPVVIATWEIGEGEHALHIMPNIFEEDDKFDPEVFKQFVKLLAFLVEHFLLNTDQALVLGEMEGADQFNLSDQFKTKEE